MTAASSARRTSRPIRREVPTHLFTVGQCVRLKGGFGVPALWADTYRVVATLPPLGSSPQYRIRDYDERHERVATQDTLEPVRTLPAGNIPPSSKGLSAMAKGQKRSNREIRKPKTGKGTA